MTDKVREALEDIAGGRINITDEMLASKEALHVALTLFSQERAREALASLSSPSKGEEERYIPDIVKNAMLVAWREICADTGCHPLDIEHGKNKHLIFEPRHWAQMAGEIAAAQIPRLYAGRASQPVAATEWQPIETAPRDGSWLIGWSEKDKSPYRVSWGRDHNGRLAWCTAFSGFIDGYITHWMPLPTSPSPPKEEGK